MRDLLLGLALLGSLGGGALPVWALTIPEDTKIKIKYTSPATNKIGAKLDFYVKKDVFIKDKYGKKQLSIPVGTKGQTIITRLGGVKEDIIMDTDSYITLKNGTKIKLNHYKNARKGARKTAKVARYAALVNPIGVVAAGAQMGIKRGTNKYNLPAKLFVAQDTEF